jgi:hypothetical protein
MTKKVILTTNIKRDRTCLYCCGTTDDGFLTIMRVERSDRSKGIKKRK